MRRLLAPGAAVVLAAALPGGGAAAQAPGQGPIVFSARAGEPRSADIHLRSVTGAVRRLTRHRAQDATPALSPDGRRIAFSSDRGGAYDIYVMRSDGTAVRRLTRAAGHDRYPAWSPDGERLVFTSERDGGEPEIYTMRADGSRQRRLTRTRRAVMDIQPSYSPDGRSIVFASNRVAYFNLEIFRMRATDGGRIERLTRFGTGGDGDPGDDVMPEYAPDGSRIAWVSDRSGSLQIWTMAPDGSDLRRVTSHVGRDVYFPRWSADGTALAYMTSTPRGATRIWTRVLAEPRPVAVARGAEPDW